MLSEIHNRVFGRGKVYTDFEAAILRCVSDALPDEDSKTLTEQAATMTSAHRYFDDGKQLSVACFYWKYLGGLRRDHRRSWADVEPEWKIATVTATCGSQIIKGEVFGAHGAFFSIETTSNSDYAEPLSPDFTLVCDSTFRHMP
jgi:hypothetical protein